MGTEVLDLNEFRKKLQTFNKHYLKDFDRFWVWKLKEETRNEHILDDSHREETCRRLWVTLRGWQAYRPYNSNECLRILEDSLRKMSDAYNQIRVFTLLEFDEVPSKPLELIWHELGRVKEEGGETDTHGYYYIVSLSKHLMFLWGQTLAFDSRVRARIPWSYNAPKGNRWCFDDWKRIMKSFQEDLRQDREALNAFRSETLNRFGANPIVPYGRYLDVYYH